MTPLRLPSRAAWSPSIRLSGVLVGAVLGALALGRAIVPGPSTSGSQAPPGRECTRAQAGAILQRQPGCFVPNLGQWQHGQKFVHRSGPMTLFLQDRGWVLDVVERPARPDARPQGGRPHEPVRCAPCQWLPTGQETDQKIRGVALRMTFEGNHVPGIVGEERLAAHHDYFLGNDEHRWRTRVPLYASVRYRSLYAGIDVRLREVDGVPEYDLLLEPGADLSSVIVRVEGADRLSIAADGSLVIDTPLGPLTQRRPETWQVGPDGNKRHVPCTFRLLGTDRFGFLAPSWERDTSLTIDPGLVWSTFLGGGLGPGANDFVTGVHADAGGLVIVTGWTNSTDFPTTTGAYDRTFSNGSTPTVDLCDVFVSRLDPGKTGAGQLLSSTYLGGSGEDRAEALAVDAAGVVTLTGSTASIDFPATAGAYDTTYNGGSPRGDAFVSRLDLGQTGAAQLAYSTFLGGTNGEFALALSVAINGVVTVAGTTASTDFPTTGAYDTTNGGYYDVFVSRLDPRKSGTAQLVYSTFLGGDLYQESAYALAVDANGVITLAGSTYAPNFPTTSGAYDTTFNGALPPTTPDGFVSRLDPRKSGTAQLVYSTFLGGRDSDWICAISPNSLGTAVTVVGTTASSDFPATSGAYDTTWNGAADTFVSRLLLLNVGSSGLVYSTFLGGSREDTAFAMAEDAESGMVTVTGSTASPDFPATSNAYDTTYSPLSGYAPGDVFVSRLAPNRPASAQLVYSTFLGDIWHDNPYALSVDAAGVVTVAGYTSSSGFPTTGGAFDTTFNGGLGNADGFVSRLSMGVPFYADRYQISLGQAGTQSLQLDAGKQHAGRSYAIFGSASGTSPGITLPGIHVPLNYDPYTGVTIAAAVPPIWGGFHGVLDQNGEATGSLNVPRGLPVSMSGLTLFHAYLVFDSGGRIYMASNPVMLKLVK